MNNNKWEFLESNAPARVVGALKKLNAFFDGRKLAEWAGNLYDPEIGGFYYSNSARDTEGYAPDLESTWQTLTLLSSFGGISSLNAIPDDIKEKIVKFTKSTQSPVDGYFYHPQWPQGKENLQSDRYGRDMGWACALIKNLKPYGEDQYPNYCTPTGTKCKAHADNDDNCFKKSAPAASSVETAPVQRRPQDPDYSSREAFCAWLEEYEKDIKIASGNAHMLAALRDEIVAKGYGNDILDFYDRIQAELYEEQISAGIEPTGVWQTNMDYHVVWGVWKHLYYYNYGPISRPINLKYVPYMVRSCVKVLMMKIDRWHAMNDLFNQWVSIGAIIDNVRRHHGEEAVMVVYDIVRESAAELVDATIEKISPFKLDDGTVVYCSNGLGMKSIYGVPIAEGVREGDANGVGLWCSMYNAVFKCLGYPVVKIMDESDGERFIEIIKNRQPIVKHPSNR